MGFKANHHGFLAFAEAVGLHLEPFQRKIARAADDVRKLLVLLPRGNGKSRLIGTVAVHHLLTTDKPAVYLAAASRDQPASSTNMRATWRCIRPSRIGSPSAT